VADETDDEWLSGKDAGRLADVNPATIWRAARSGLIGYRTSPGGGSWRYRKSDLEKWVHNRRPIEDRVADLEAAVSDLKAWRAGHEEDHP
jgi:hypothetical protein